MNIEYKTEQKLLNICDGYIKGKSNKSLMNLSKVKQDDRWLNILQNNWDEFDYLLPRFIYKLLAHSCETMAYTRWEATDGTIPFVSKDFKNYIPLKGENHEFSFEVVQSHIKVIALLSSQNISFPIKPITAWIDYLKRNYDTGDGAVIYDLCYPFYILSMVLHSLENSKIKTNISANYKKILYELLGYFLPKCNRVLYDKSSLNHIYTLFKSEGEDFIINTKEWTDFVYSEAKKNNFEDLFLHFSKFTSPKPSKNLLRWKKQLVIIAKDKDTNDLINLYINTVDEILKEDPTSFPFSSSYNLILIKGYIYAMYIIDPKKTHSATVKLRKYSCIKVPDIGVCLPQIINICDKVLPKPNYRKLP